MQPFTLHPSSLRKGFMALGVLVLWNFSLGGNSAFAECGDYVVMMGAAHSKSPAAGDSESRSGSPAKVSKVTLEMLDLTDRTVVMPLSSEPTSPAEPCDSWSCRQKDRVKTSPASRTLSRPHQLSGDRTRTPVNLFPTAGSTFPRCRNCGDVCEGYLLELEKPPQHS